jgi:arginine/lysine/ornithine decarboxylase
MILGSTKRGDRILVNRNAHKSIYNAMILQDLVPSYVAPRVHDEWGVTLGVDTKAIAPLLASQSYACAVLTTPAYEGGMTDLSVLRASKTPLLIDAAHGAHLPILGVPPVQADASVESLHKTTPAMTQTAVINYRSDRLDEDRIDHYLSALMTSSPSYILMASIDLALGRLTTTGEAEMVNLLSLIERFEEEVADTGFKVLRFEGQDPTKILLSGVDLGIDGLTLQRELRQVHRIAVEYARPAYCLLMASISNEASDFERLLMALRQMAAGANGSPLTYGEVGESRDFPKMVATPREAFDRPKRSLALSEAAGAVAAEFVTPYPPGIPLIVPGEEITREMVERIRSMREKSIQIVGTKDHTLETLQVLR